MLKLDANPSYRALRDGFTALPFQALPCQATITLSLRDRRVDHLRLRLGLAAGDDRI
jgi:hypothetical protein